MDGHNKHYVRYNDWKYDQWKANITSREGPQLKAGWGRPLVGGEPIYFESSLDIPLPSPSEYEPYISTPKLIPDSYKKTGVYYDVDGKSEQWKGVRSRISNMLSAGKKKIPAGSRSSLFGISKFAGGSLALGAILPGEGISNLIGAAGSIGAYQYTKGSTGIKFGAAAATYAVTKGLASLFSGRDDSYNTIQGLRHGGFAEQGRLGLTDFGSGVKEKVVNRAKNTLMRLYRGTREAHVVQEAAEGTYDKYRRNRPAAEVFERIRKAEFPHRPSRHESTFWSPNAGIAHGYGYGESNVDLRKAKPGDVISSLAVVDVEKDKAFLTSGDFWSEAVYAEERNDLLGMEKAARKYWKGIPEPGIEYTYTPEVLIPGKVTEHTNIMFRKASRWVNSLFPGKVHWSKESPFEIEDLESGKIAFVEKNVGFHNIQQSNTPVNKIPGRDDSYNTIQGMHPGTDTSLGARNIKDGTEFGSGWDPLRKFANRMFGKERGNVFKKMIKSKDFREALVGGEVIKELGGGLQGTAHLMEATFRGEKIRYVRKNIESEIAEKWAMFGESFAPSRTARQEALETEFKALRRVSDRSSPTPYFYSKKTDELYMEFMEGQTLNKIEEVPEHIVAKIRQEAEIAGKRGIFNPDIHRGNIIYDEPTGRVAWLDFGLAQRSNRRIKKEEFELMNQRITEKIVPPITVKQQTPPPMQAAPPEGGFEDFGDVAASLASVPSRPLPVPPPNVPPRNKPFTPIPGKDDAYNEIEGLRHGGLAEVGRKGRTDFGSGWKTDVVTFIKGNLTAEEEEAVKYTPHRGMITTDSITSVNKKNLSFIGKILSDINIFGGRASKILRESSHEVNRIPFEMAYNGGKKHRESAASRSISY